MANPHRALNDIRMYLEHGTTFGEKEEDFISKRLDIIEYELDCLEDENRELKGEY